MEMDRSLGKVMAVLVRANSKESIEYILQALWRTRKSGLGTADRCVIEDMLQLQNESDLDPLLVCLRMLMRRCVYDNTSKEDIPKLFPNEVSPELQKLLTLLLHKFQPQWQQDLIKDQLQNDAPFYSEEQDLKFKLATDSLENMLKAMHSIRGQFSTVDEAERALVPVKK